MRIPWQGQHEQRQDLENVPHTSMEDDDDNNDDNSFENHNMFDPTDDQELPPAHGKSKKAEDVCVHPHINGK
jgi:hypothetical protein